MSDEIKSNFVVNAAGFPFFIIPFPTPIPTKFGIEATSGPNGCWLQCRATYPEREKIQAAADRIGLTKGELMRRIMNDVAEYILTNVPETE